MKANTMVRTKSIYDNLFSNLILDEGYVLAKIDSQTLIIYFISSISKVHFIDWAIYCIIDCKIWNESFFIGLFTFIFWNTIISEVTVSSQNQIYSLCAHGWRIYCGTFLKFFLILIAYNFGPDFCVISGCGNQIWFSSFEVPRKTRR